MPRAPAPLSEIFSTYCWPSLFAKLPRYAATHYRCCHHLPEPLSDHRFPRHETESHAIVKHGKPSAGKLYAAAVDAADSLPFHYRPVHQTCRGFERSRGAIDVSATKGCQQITREKDAPPTLLGQILFKQKVCALFKRFSHLAPETSVANIQRAAEQLLERMRTEGDATEADLFISADAGNLWRVKNAGLFQNYTSPALEQNVPARLRDPDGAFWGFQTCLDSLYRLRLI